MENYLIYVILILVIAFAIFLILRELNCWYWKINKRINLMEETNKLLKALVEANKIEFVSEPNPQGNVDESRDMKKQFNATEVTIKYKRTNKIERVSIDYWKKWIKTYGDDSVEVIEYHE
jgi:hypothetical protein